MPFDELTNYVNVKSEQYGLDIIGLSQKEYFFSKNDILQNTCFLEKIENKQVSHQLMSDMNDSINAAQNYYDNGDTAKASTTCLWIASVLECSNYESIQEVLDDNNSNYLSVPIRIFLMMNNINSDYPGFKYLSVADKEDVLTLALVYKSMSKNNKSIAYGQNAYNQSAVNACFQSWDSACDRAFAIYYVGVSASLAAIIFGGFGGAIAGLLGLTAAGLQLYDSICNAANQLYGCLGSAGF